MADRRSDPGRPAGAADGPAAAPSDIVLVGAGRRASAWLAHIRGSPRLRAVGVVTRDAGPSPAELPRCATLAEAMQRYPAASFAVALPPRAGLDAAMELAEAGRAGIVEAPLHDALADARHLPQSDDLRVAHGWVTLAGLRAIAAVMRHAEAGRLFIELAGSPEDDCADSHETLVHAAALLRALLPDATPTGGRSPDGGTIELDLTAPGAGGHWTVQLRLRLRGQRLAVRVETTGEAAQWTWDGERERVVRGQRELIAPRTPAPAEARALAQLLPDAVRGDGLVEAAAALRLTRACESLLPPMPLGARAFRQSASLAQRRPSDVLARLGLRGTMPAASAAAPATSAVRLPPEPFELWAFRAGVKPVVFLTVRPDEVERTLSYFGDAHCERRERRVQVDAQDRWTDRRDQGAPHVELYISRDAALAREMARLQADEDPTAALCELGALAGYPPCCVDAFARQDDRANNSRNRYYTYARTLGTTGALVPSWPWQLNNLHTMTVPFYPCSYRCAAALAWARASHAELARAHPSFAAALQLNLARPVLYFDHEHQLNFDGVGALDGEQRRVAYRAVALPDVASPELAGLAAAIARGDQLMLDDRYLKILKRGEVIVELARTDPALGFVAPFGAE
jgi:predicted dehydrogenase